MTKRKTSLYRNQNGSLPKAREDLDQMIGRREYHDLFTHSSMPHSLSVKTSELTELRSFHPGFSTTTMGAVTAPSEGINLSAGCA